MPLSSGSKLGPYRILTQLGKGGMGEVYRAKDTRLDRDIAIKVLAEDLAFDPVAIKLFEREAKAIAALSHPNILSIYEFEMQDDISFFVTELLEGETLRKRIMNSPISSEKALEIAIGIADGLSAAHLKGIIHRDLKPENIFLTSDGRVKILDFGLARLKRELSEQELTQAETKSAETKPGIVRGTIPYMSPEQVRGNNVDARTDIFSFGCVLYEMLTGKRAFCGQSPADTISAILKEQPPIQELPLQLQEIIKHCVEKNPEQRFHSAHDLGLALKAVYSGSAITGSLKPKLTVRRLVSISATVFVLIALLIGFFLWKRTRASLSASKAIGSIAVLPLANISGDPQQDYFSDGMTDELITDLSKIKALRVISRTSIMQYKATKKPLSQIARELNVDAVVEGSVLRSENRVRIAAQLIDATTDAHIWSETYENDLRDVLTLQQEVARAIAREIRIKVTPQEVQRLTSSSPVNPEAHEFYLKGMYQCDKCTREGFQIGITDMEQSLAKDANYALAYAGLANCKVWRALMGFGSFSLPDAKTAAIRALELDEELAVAHSALGHSKLALDWDWKGSEQEHKRAIELNPGDSNAHAFYSFYLRLINRFGDAISQARIAQQLDPISPYISHMLAACYFDAGQYNDAIAEYNKAIDLDPNYVFSHAHLAWSFVRKGMLKEALAQSKKIRSLSPEGQSIGVDAWLFGIYIRTGKHEEAQKLFNKWKEVSEHEKIDPYFFARMYGCMGEKDLAFEWLNKTYNEHSPSIIYSKVDDCFEPLQNDPRFVEILGRVGFPTN